MRGTLPQEKVLQTQASFKREQEATQLEVTRLRIRYFAWKYPHHLKPADTLTPATVPRQLGVENSSLQELLEMRRSLNCKIAMRMAHMVGYHCLYLDYCDN